MRATGSICSRPRAFASGCPVSAGRRLIDRPSAVRPCTSSAAAGTPLAAVHSSSSSRRGLLRRQQLLPVRAAEEGSSGASSSFDFEQPETAKDAIDLGLVLCQQQKWDKALGVFEKGLTLPGTGVKRFRDKPRLVSDGEKMALLYNVACCHSQLQDARSGLVALSGCLETGYSDFAQVRSDPDLAFLRTDPRFEGLLERFQGKGGGFLGFNLSGIFGNK